MVPSVHRPSSVTTSQRALTPGLPGRDDGWIGVPHHQCLGEIEMDQHTAEPGGSGNVIAARDCLVGRIVAELRSRGYYLAHIDSQAGQVLIDLRWAAQVAGRTVGRRTRTYASTVGKQL